MGKPVITETGSERVDTLHTLTPDAEATGVNKVSPDRELEVKRRWYLIVSAVLIVGAGAVGIIFRKKNLMR